MRRGAFIEEPQIFVSHTEERNFIGPGAIQLRDGSLLMAAPWGRPPTNFEQLAATCPVPMLCRSTDGGRTWQEQGRMKMEWNLTGMISDGGVTFLYLQDGRLAFQSHRHVQGLHGGGLPVISFSDDEGASWTPARMIGEPEGVWYVMNERLIQMRSGRLVVPCAHAPQGEGYVEGDGCFGTCFYSDDAGDTWKRSQQLVGLSDGRGMAEPAVAEVDGGRLLMLARTGSGCNYASWSDDGGDTWSDPEPTTQTAACSSLTLAKMPDGRLIVLYNHAEPLGPGAFFPRTPLCYSISDDGGRTWDEPVLIDESGVLLGDRQSIYPSVTFTEEGMVVVYSTHVADPEGGFAHRDSHLWHDCGGKRCVLAYPN